MREDRTWGRAARAVRPHGKSALAAAHA